MFYEIQSIEDDRLYLASGGHYVSQSGVIGDGTVEPTWVLGAGNGIGTSSLEHAQLLADRYGGRPVPSQGQGRERSRSRINQLRDQLNDDDRFYGALDVLISAVGLRFDRSQRLNGQLLPFAFVSRSRRRARLVACLMVVNPKDHQKRPSPDAGPHSSQQVFFADRLLSCGWSLGHLFHDSGNSIGFFFGQFGRLGLWINTARLDRI
jgi:hypothetical protein